MVGTRIGLQGGYPVEYCEAMIETTRVRPRGANGAGLDIGLKIAQWTTDPRWRIWCPILFAIYTGIVVAAFMLGHN